MNPTNCLWSAGTCHRFGIAKRGSDLIRKRRPVAALQRVAALQKGEQDIQRRWWDSKNARLVNATAASKKYNHGEQDRDAGRKEAVLTKRVNHKCLQINQPQAD